MSKELISHPVANFVKVRGATSTRSSVGSVTAISNLIRMLYSRAGDYPAGQSIVYAESFLPNTPEGACPECHGLGVAYEVTEHSMVPDDSRSIREKATVCSDDDSHLCVSCNNISGAFAAHKSR